MENQRTAASHMDASHPLLTFRERFYVQPGTIYLDGNSLGLMSRDAEAAVLRVLQEWKEHAIDGWTKAQPAWFDLPERLGALTAPLIGARPHEVVVSGGTTINLHALLATFYQPVGQRTLLLADTENFPSDLYAFASHVALRNRPAANLVMIPPAADGLIREEQIVEQMAPDVAVVVLPAVWYKSGQLLDIPSIARIAQERGILFGVDACHSIGVVPHRFHDWGVDFAVWCNYKYLNGGPGATAGLFVHERHHHRAPGLSGWFGSDKRRQFDMAYPMAPSGHAGQWQIGTPPILATAPVEASLRMIAEAGIETVRHTSLRLTEYLRERLEERIIATGLGGRVVTPRSPQQRGGHIAFQHDRAIPIGKTLRQRGVIPDFRPPNILRLAPVPLYTSFTDVWDAVETLRDILQSRSYETAGDHRDVVS